MNELDMAIARLLATLEKHPPKKVSLTHPQNQKINFCNSDLV